MNYEIIKNRVALLNFIDWLPETIEETCYYGCLFSREKYVRHLNISAEDKISGKAQLSRFVANDKDWLLRKIEKLEIKKGAYKDAKKKGLEVPEESLALYVMPNPRSHIIAAKNTLIELANKITNQYDGYNVQSVALNNYQDQKVKKTYYDIDFDGVEFEELLPQIKENINLDACTFLRTRDGFHLLVNMSQVKLQYRKTWQPKLSSLQGADVRGDQLLPVPGCVQGNFVPEFISL